MIAHIITPNGMTLFLNGQIININKNSTKFSDIMELFDDGLTGDSLKEGIEEILYSTNDLEECFSKDLSEFEGIPMHPFFVEKLRKLYDEGYPTQSIKEFFNKYSENPSFELVQLENISNNEFGLFGFLQANSLPLTEDGCFLAYKGVQGNYYSINGNTKTRIIRGTSNASGQVFNKPGEVIECHRGDVDPSRAACSTYGLHVGSLQYATNWAGEGGKVVIVKVDPKDVVSVPKMEEHCKCRVCKYEVIQEVEKEIVQPVVSVEQGEVKESLSEWNTFVERVRSYLDKKFNQAGELGCIDGASVSIRQIQSSFSPDYPSKTKVLAALQELGECVEGDLVYFNC
jgi:hypothetical protein